MPSARILVYSRTTAYRHDSIPAAVAAVRTLGFDVDATDGERLGARFDRHPDHQPGEAIVEDHDHPAMGHLPPVWEFTDEWYDFRANPRGAVRVLARADESSYEGGRMGRTPS